MALKAAEIALAQPRLGLHGQVKPRGQRFGSQPCSRQVAGHHDVDPLGPGRRQPIGQPSGLPDARGRQRDVELALDPAARVPRRLAVADQQQARAGGGSYASLGFRV
jgi:hypothetical protein